MINDKKLLGFITARGGSKRLPNKNILELAGKPLIAWTIEAALDSKYIDRVIVSTDDEKIANISQKYGADVPFMRPAELSTDTATSIDVIEHGLNTLAESGDNYDYITLLQPTSPLRTSRHIDESVNIFLEKNANSVISVTETSHSPLWANEIPESGSMKGFLRDDVKNKRSQDLPIYYQLNGAIYISKISSLLNERSFFQKNDVYAYKMERLNSVDIDSKIDFEFASLLIR